MVIKKDSPFSSEFQLTVGFCVPSEKAKRNGNWEAVMGMKKKEGAVNSSPLPLPVLHQLLSSLLQCLMSPEKRPIIALGLPRFSSLAPPLLLVLYISPFTTFCRVYNVLPESHQAVYRERPREEERERKSVSGFLR